MKCGWQMLEQSRTQNIFNQNFTKIGHMMKLKLKQDEMWLTIARAI